MNNQKECECLYFLMCTEVIGNTTIRKLHNYFGSYENIYTAPVSELNQILNATMLDKFIADRNIKNIEFEFSRLYAKGISFYMYGDGSYPDKLYDLADAPPALLVNGKLPSPSVPSVAIIGSRGCSTYGKAKSSDYARYLSSQGIQIISGMALGVDGIAGRAALQGGTSSFAVVGSGPDICYPTTNTDLFEQLVIRGGIISEYPLGSPGLPWHFPQRNRIISGLCDALIVIEAKEKSGTLITVDTALEQGRDVYALPGREGDSLSLGCNMLIKQGAGILISPEDFLSDFITSVIDKPGYEDFFKQRGYLSSSAPVSSNIMFNNIEETVIYNCLDYSPISLDQLCLKVNEEIQLGLSSIIVHLTNMCIAGVITNISGTYYVRT